MEQNPDTTIENNYVRDYYNDHLAENANVYENERWHASPAATYDYEQTKRAIAAALGARSYDRVIEIGPGDGVWTPLLQTSVTGSLHLVEQSTQMLERAKERLSTYENISFEESDWQQSDPPKEADLVFAIRCFEYFEDKLAGLKKMHAHMAPGGCVIIVTKNADLYTSVNVQDKKLHSDQVTKSEMVQLLQSAGFVVKAVYPATVRWKVKYSVARLFFTAVHRVALATNGLVRIPWLSNKATESYTYVAVRP